MKTVFSTTDGIGNDYDEDKLYFIVDLPRLEYLSGLWLGLVKAKKKELSAKKFKTTHLEIPIKGKLIFHGEELPKKLFLKEDAA